jgi:hypothetical protein
VEAVHHAGEQQREREHQPRAHDGDEELAVPVPQIGQGDREHVGLLGPMSEICRC